MHFEKVILFGSFEDRDPKLAALFYSFLFIFISFCTFGRTLITGWSWVGWLYIPEVKIGVTVMFTFCTALQNEQETTLIWSKINVQNKGSVTIECMSRSILWYPENGDLLLLEITSILFVNKHEIEIISRAELFVHITEGRCQIESTQK